MYYVPFSNFKKVELLWYLKEKNIKFVFFSKSITAMFLEATINQEGRRQWAVYYTK